MYLPQKLPDFNVGKTVKIFCLTFSLLGFDRTQLAACFSRSETGTVKSTDPTLKIGRTGEQFSSTGCVLPISQWTTCEIITSSIKIIANWCFARGFSWLGKLNISQGMHGSARKAPNQFTRSPDDSLFQFPFREEEKNPKTDNKQSGPNNTRRRRLKHMNIRPDPFGALREREPSKIIIFYARPKFHDFSTLGRARSSKTHARSPFSFREEKNTCIFPNYYLTIPASSLGCRLFCCAFSKCCAWIWRTTTTWPAVKS